MFQINKMIYLNFLRILIYSNHLFMHSNCIDILNRSIEYCLYGFGCSVGHFQIDQRCPNIKSFVFVSTKNTLYNHFQQYIPKIDCFQRTFTDSSRLIDIGRMKKECHISGKEMIMIGNWIIVKGIDF